MSEKNKNINRQDSDFFRYHSNRMTDKERNAFEKKLQKDPFADEASEGFSSLDPEVAERDLAELDDRIRKRNSGSRRRIWYGIAASIAVMIAISSIFFHSGPKDRNEEIAYSPPAKQEEELIIRKEEPVKESQEYETVNTAEKTSDERMLEAAQPPAIVSDEPAFQEDRQQEKIKEEFKVEDHETIRRDVVAAARQVPSVAKKMVPRPVYADRAGKAPASISGRIISSEDNQPIPGASIEIKGTSKGTVTDEDGNFNLEGDTAENIVLVASFLGMDSKEFNPVPGSGNEIRLDPSALSLSEVVVVGYGVSRKSSGSEYAASGYSPPAPVTGRKEFNTYISENMVRPDTVTSGQRNIVVLAFRVSEDGKVDSIEVVRSPGEIFSREAIRLIKEGPAWKPATENGMTIPDEVRIRIVFK